MSQKRHHVEFMVSPCENHSGDIRIVGQVLSSLTETDKLLKKSSASRTLGKYQTHDHGTSYDLD